LPNPHVRIYQNFDGNRPNLMNVILRLSSRILKFKGIFDYESTVEQLNLLFTYMPMTYFNEAFA
jgi:hypothetical protein